jgi:hypothetical protein
MKMKTAKEVIAHIKNMEYAERHKVVKEIGDYVWGPESKLLTDLLVEHSKLKQDIEYLSGKVGLYDMYFNRINK